MSIASIDRGTHSVALLALDEQLTLELAGDSAAEIAALLLLGARDSRNQAHAVARAEEQHLSELQAQQIDELHAQAEATRNAGFAKGMGLIASGTANVLSSAAMTSDPPSARAAPGQLAQGGGEFLASAYEFEASRHGARATEAANRGDHVERRLQELAQAKSEAAQLTRDALQAASELARTEAATEQATLYLRG
jgi:hypothetical protein